MTMKIKSIFSPNFDKSKRSKKSIKVIVIHYTGMQSERESINRLCDPKHKVSSHFLINRTGKIYRLVNDDLVAWHAGKSCWGKFKNLNKNSIGIELVNKGHQFGYTSFSKKQLLSLIRLCKNLIKIYKIKKENIVGHSDIAPTRKTDPGEKFPWDMLAKNKIGLWHYKKFNSLKKLRKIKVYLKKDKEIFTKNLINIGYCPNSKNKFFSSQVIRAFQRHFRKQLIDGVIDEECLAISNKLIKNI